MHLKARHLGLPAIFIERDIGRFHRNHLGSQLVRAGQHIQSRRTSVSTSGEPVSGTPLTLCVGSAKVFVHFGGQCTFSGVRVNPHLESTFTAHPCEAFAAQLAGTSSWGQTQQTIDLLNMLASPLCSLAP